MTVPHESSANRFGLRPVALGRRGMVAVANPLATLAGLSILARGGNAVDAAVAAAAAIGVVEPYMSGLAGCGVAMLTRPGAEPRSLVFLGRAPAGATADALRGANRTSGPLSVAVPGNLAGWARLLADHGTMALADVLEPAAELAETGFPMTVFDRLLFDESRPHQDVESVRTYYEDGRTPALGAIVRQSSLARTLRQIGRDGIGTLYGGELGAGVVAALAAGGGGMTLADLEQYPDRLAWSDPLSVDYRGVRVCAPPPPSSAIQVLETLNAIGGWEVGGLEHLGPDHLSLIADASWAARLDTERLVGDPDVVPVPVAELLGHAHTEELRTRMGDRRFGPDSVPARSRTRPDAAGGGAPAASTTHLAVCDASGLAVNITQSLGGGFGSGVVVPGTGVALNNALHWTSLEEGHPNLVGPGKRHEWPVAPVHLVRDGELWATVGTPGSYGILVTTVQVLVNLVDFGLNVQEAIGAPRFRWNDEAVDPLPARSMAVESRVPEATLRAMHEDGYAIEMLGPWSMRVGGVQAIVRDRAGGWLQGGADPRRNGYAMGW